ncbi:MAG: GNAT family N-acetyltransferase [Steroidobacteraceae bacterium]
MRVQAETLERITDVPGAEWDALDIAGHPFLRHGFLEALESTGCVGMESGWVPRHLVLRDPHGRLAGAVPRYFKTHSWGEFVFDWNWAQSALRAGLPYYPKLVAAVPFTPVTGPRLLATPGAAAAMRGELARQLVESALRDAAQVTQVNFTTADDQASLLAAGFLARHDCRFLWRNRGYRDFDDFLDTFRAEKRKKLRRERRRVAEAGVTFDTLAGEAIDPGLWQVIFGFSEQTFLRHGNPHYLTAEFLQLVSQKLPGVVMVKLARIAGEPVAAAIFFQDGTSLYGRYWGAARHVDCLHFEACYHQGIEWCIERGLAEFDPGTQGEHKLARGFEPTLTRSAHWFAHPGLSAAIGRYLERERAAVGDYMAAAAAHLPFQRDAPA